MASTDRQHAFGKQSRNSLPKGSSRLTSLFLVLLSLCPATLQTQAPPTRPGSPPSRSRLDSLVRAAITDLPLASASVAVLRGNDTLILAAHGQADLEHRVRATPNTVYRIGSITKQFTAVAVLQQVERGALKLDDDITRHLPELAPSAKRVTIRQLLNHTSGLRDFGDLGDRFLAVRSTDLPQRDVLALIGELSFASDPGTAWRYSNAGYYLLGIILERITGRRYVEYLKERVWDVVGLTRTGYCDRREIVSNRAKGYDAVGTHFLNAQAVSVSVLFSSEGLCSTAGDLAKWARALRAGKLISQASYRMMTSPEGAAAHANPPYGFGVWVKKFEGRRYITHLGLTDGFNGTLADVWPDSLTIAILTNTSGYGASTLGGQLGAALLGIPEPSFTKAVRPVPPRGKPLRADDGRRYIGRYGLRMSFQEDTLGGNVTLEVFNENGRLMAQLTGDPAEALEQIGRHEFAAVGRPDMHFTFDVEEGRATRVTVVAPTFHGEGSRTP